MPGARRDHRPNLPWLALGALQHYAFCPRQAVVLFRDRQWADDAATARGQAQHIHVDTTGTDHRRGVRVHNRVPLRSDRLCLHGIADAIEEHPDGQLIPIEHKSGDTQLGPARIQVIGQALCLADMTGRHVPAGIVYVRSTKKRHTFPVTDQARSEIAEVADAAREALSAITLPPPHPNLAACRTCSIYALCLPQGDTRD
jgi:CRISPR-associated exonuclease Cas4